VCSRRIRADFPSTSLTGGPCLNKAPGILIALQCAMVRMNLYREPPFSGRNEPENLLNMLSATLHSIVGALSSEWMRLCFFCDKLYFCFHLDGYNIPTEHLLYYCGISAWYLESSERLGSAARVRGAFSGPGALGLGSSINSAKLIARIAPVAMSAIAAVPQAATCLARARRRGEEPRRTILGALPRGPHTLFHHSLPSPSSTW